MKKPRKRVPYYKPSKRSLMKDIFTDAGRRALNRAAEKEAENCLRAALDNPTDTKGKPIAAHLLKKIAAERLVTSEGSDPIVDFYYATEAFISKVRYRWGCGLSISSLWRTFLRLVQEADPRKAAEFAKHYDSAFRWYVAGHMHRLHMEYEERPDAIVKVEIWHKRNECFFVGVQRDGDRRMMPSDCPPEFPILLFAGAKMHHFIAPKDLVRIKRMGSKRFLAALKSGKIKFSQRPEALLDQDTLLNITPPTDDDLPEIRRSLSGLSFKSKSRWRPST